MISATCCSSDESIVNIDIPVMFNDDIRHDGVLVSMQTQAPP